MKQSHSLLKLASVCAIGVASVCLFGCGSKDVDPGQKVDAPGYYNGPMDKGKSKAPKGGAEAGGAKADAQ